MAINGDADGNGHAADFLGTYFHGHATTHLDALCHIWQDGLIWNGRRAVDSVDVRGASFGGIEHWANGIFTRGVLLDVPRHRGEPFVSEDRPVQAEELAEIARLDRLDIRPGDALAVYGGRAAFEVAHGPLGSTYATPGLHLSCLDFLREVDCSVLLWDLLDARPIADGHPWGVHAAIITLGIALVDNVALEPLAAACEEERRHDFALVVAPLPVVGGTGSPVNPLALL